MGKIKIPNKIYITEYNTNVHTGYFSRNQDDVFTEEYINKDTLMEWIQEARAIPHENAIVRDLAFQEIVNKLNSM